MLKNTQPAVCCTLQCVQREEEMGEEGAVSPADLFAPPLLPPRVAVRALGSLREVCEALLQFLEQTVGQPGAGEGEEEGQARHRAVQAALAAAAVRVVGRCE